MFFFSKKADKHFSEATAGIEKYISMYKQAVEAAKVELQNIEVKVAEKINLYDSKIEAAYSKYMAKEAKYGEKSARLMSTSEARKSELESIAELAQRAVDNHNRIYLGK